MIFPPTTEVALISVADPGVPNRERVVFRPMQAIDLISYGVLVGLRQDNGAAIPLNDHFFWFGQFIVELPSWILLYTGSGVPKTTRDANTNQPIYEFYWNKPTTIFGAEDIVPVLFRFGAVAVGTNVAAPVNRPSLLEALTKHKPENATLGEIFKNYQANKKSENDSLLQALLESRQPKDSNTSLYQALLEGRQPKDPKPTAFDQLLEKARQSKK